MFLIKVTISLTELLNCYTHKSEIIFHPQIKQAHINLDPTLNKECNQLPHGVRVRLQVVGTSAEIVQEFQNFSYVDTRTLFVDYSIFINYSANVNVATVFIEDFIHFVHLSIRAISIKTLNTTCISNQSELSNDAISLYLEDTCLILLSNTTKIVSQLYKQKIVNGSIIEYVDDGHFESMLSFDGSHLVIPVNILNQKKVIEMGLLSIDAVLNFDMGSKLRLQHYFSTYSGMNLNHIQVRSILFFFDNRISYRVHLDQEKLAQLLAGISYDSVKMQILVTSENSYIFYQQTIILSNLNNTDEHNFIYFNNSDFSGDVNRIINASKVASAFRFIFYNGDEITNIGRLDEIETYDQSFTNYTLEVVNDQLIFTAFRASKNQIAFDFRVAYSGSNQIYLILEIQTKSKLINLTLPYKYDLDYRGDMVISYNLTNVERTSLVNDVHVCYTLCDFQYNNLTSYSFSTTLTSQIDRIAFVGTNISIGIVIAFSLFFILVYPPIRDCVNRSCRQRKKFLQMQKMKAIKMLDEPDEL